MDAKTKELLEAAKSLLEPAGVATSPWDDRKERLAAAVRNFEVSGTTGETAKPMTEQDALDEARRLWGPRGGIFDRKNAFSSSYPKRFWVGCEAIRDYQGQHLYGNGNTWEEAFADAVKRQEKMVR